MGTVTQPTPKNLTLARVAEWVDFWLAPGDPNDPGPATPAEIPEYWDRRLRGAASEIVGAVRAVERSRSQVPEP